MFTGFAHPSNKGATFSFQKGCADRCKGQQRATFYHTIARICTPFKIRSHFSYHTFAKIYTPLKKEACLVPRTAGHVRITLARSHFRYHLFPKIYTPSRIRRHFSYHTSQRFMGHSQKKLSATSLCGSTTPPSQDLHTLSNKQPFSASTLTRICTPSLTSSRFLLPHLQGSTHPLQQAAVFCFHIYKDLHTLSNQQPVSASTFSRICTPSLTSSQFLLPHLQGSAHPL